MMNDRLLPLLGLARRAGRLSLGYDAACESIAKGEAALVLVTEDISPGSLKRLSGAAEGCGVSVKRLPCEMPVLAAAIGKSVRIVSVNDGGFARKADLLLQEGEASE